MDGSAALLRVDDLCFAYPSRPLFAHWYAAFAPGLHLVCGDDGSGKTTLLRLLAGELPAQSGQLQIGGYLLSADAPVYRRQVFRTDPASDAFEQWTPMAWFAQLLERYPAFDMALAAQLLERLFLSQHLDKTGHMMSTGSRRKVWLVAALASGAPVVLIDQPFAALDTPSIRVVTELLQPTAQQSGRVIVLADYEAQNDLRLNGRIALG
jgi:ABC-type multidrug transport system ATPase subunit